MQRDSARQKRRVGCRRAAGWRHHQNDQEFPRGYSPEKISPVSHLRRVTICSSVSIVTFCCPVSIRCRDEAEIPILRPNSTNVISPRFFRRNCPSRLRNLKLTKRVCFAIRPTCGISVYISGSAVNDQWVDLLCLGSTTFLPFASRSQRGSFFSVAERFSAGLPGRFFKEYSVSFVSPSLFRRSGITDGRLGSLRSSLSSEEPMSVCRSVQRNISRRYVP